MTCYDIGFLLNETMFIENMETTWYQTVTINHIAKL